MISRVRVGVAPSLTLSGFDILKPSSRRHGQKIKSYRTNPKMLQNSDKLDAHANANIKKINHHTNAASLLSNSGWAFPCPEHIQ